MRTRQINSTLVGLAILLLTCAVVTVALAAILPLGLESSGDKSVGRLPTHKSGAQSLPALAAFEPIIDRNWRQSLTDSPAAAPTEAATPTGSLTLAGTVGTSLALLRRSDGTVEVKGVGESIDGSEVVAVRPHEIELRAGNGERTILRKAQEDAP